MTDTKPIVGMSVALVEFRKGLTTIPRNADPLIITINRTQYVKAWQLGMGDVHLGISMALDKIPA